MGWVLLSGRFGRVLGFVLESVVGLFVVLVFYEGCEAVLACLWVLLTEAFLSVCIHMYVYTYERARNWLDKFPFQTKYTSYY